MNTIDFKVDSEELRTTDKELTPVQIMQLAKIDPNTHYLIQLEGNHQVSYKDKPNIPIHMHEHQVFITAPTGPTTVSQF